MVLEKITDRVIETDVLVIGGGIAGCPAAAKAKEHGLEVTLVEKAKTDRSGSAGQGIGGYGSFPSGMTPRGITPGEFAGIWDKWQYRFNWEAQFANPNTIYKIYDKAFWALEELEKLGVTMRWLDGEYYWAPFPEGEGGRISLRVNWQNVKPEMAKAVRKRGVNVLERTMVVDLLTDNGKVAGATAVNNRTGEFIVIKAKAIVVATGQFARCYDQETPLFWKYKFRSHFCPASISGDGYAAAYRAGAELANMQVSGWSFRIQDDLAIQFGQLIRNDGIPARQFTWDGEETAYLPGSAQYAKQEQKGKTPLYYSLEHLPEDFQKRVELALVDQRLVSLKIAEDRGFNPRRHRYHLMPMKPMMHMAPGINVDDDFKSSLKGLYAVGDCVAGFHSCGPAATSGLLVGDSLPFIVSEAGEPMVDEAQVENQKQAALAPMAVKDGTEPMELECAIRYICERYVGVFKSEGKLREGLRRLGSLRRVFLPKLMANNPHYLMRCLEVRNIMDLAEVHINAVLEQKETRGSHIRLDYPEKAPALDEMRIYQRIEDGKAVLEIRKAPELKPEYTKEVK